VYVFSPGLRRQPEILCEQSGQLRGRFPGEDALHHVLVAGIPFRFLQEESTAWLRAEYVLATVFRQDPGGNCGGESRRSMAADTIAERWHRRSVHGELIGSSGPTVLQRSVTWSHTASMSSQYFGYLLRSHFRSAGLGTTKSNHNVAR